VNSRIIFAFLLAGAAPSAAQAFCPLVPPHPRLSTVFLPCQVTDSVHWLSAPAPMYPELLATAAIDGGVVVQFTVTRAGRVDTSSIRVFKATHELFAEAVRRALSTWRARPARRDGMNVAESLHHTFYFVYADSTACPPASAFEQLDERTFTCIRHRTHHGPAARTPPGRERSHITS
jgi:TonB family protein